MRQRLKAVVKWVLIVVAVLVAVDIGAGFYLGSRVDRQIAALKAKGEPVSAADLAGQPIPENKNSAVIYEEIFKKVDALKNQDSLLGGPVRGGSRRIGYQDVLSAKRRGEHPEAWGLATRAMSMSKDIVPMVEQAVSRPVCRFGGEPANDPRRFSRFSRMKDLIRLLAVRALVSAKAGNMADAVRSTELAIKVTESLKDQPTLMSILVQAAHLSIISHNLREVATYGAISEPQARKLFDVLARQDFRSDAVKAIQGERALCALLVWERQRKMSGPFGRAFTCADELAYLKGVQRLTDQKGLPYQHTGGDETEMPRWAVISKGLLPVYVRALNVQDVAAAQIAGSQVFLAVLALKE